MNNWTANEKQTLFLKTLKGADGKALTLAQASKMAGVEFKSGSINPLVAKGLVATADRKVNCLVVDAETGEQVGTCTKTVKAYSLVGE